MRVEEEHSPIFSDHKTEQEEKVMASPQLRRTMGDNCRRTNYGQISLGFQLENLVDFNIKSIVLPVLRDNQNDKCTI